MVRRWNALLAVVSVVFLLNGIPAAIPGEAGHEGIGARAAGARAAAVITPLVTPINNSLYAVDWDPSKDNALIVGAFGAVLDYNATTGFRSLPQDENFTFRQVAFRPVTTSSLALIAGDGRGTVPPSVLLLYDGGTFTRLDTGGYTEIKGIAWSSDASYALIAARKVNDGVILKYQGGILTEVRTDPIRNYKSLCWGEGGAYVGGFNWDLYGLNIQFFDGTAMVRDLQVPENFDSYPTGLSWSGTLHSGLCISDSKQSGGAGKLVRYNATSAANITGVTIPGDLNGLAWAHARPQALIIGIDTAKPEGSVGVLYSYNGSALVLESSDIYDGLNGVAWHRSDRYALVAGDNGTVLRYSAPNTRPWCFITEPGAPVALSGSVAVKGTARDPDGDAIVLVQVRIDAGPWQNATGSDNWSFVWDTTQYPNGQHSISARSNDGVDDSFSDDRIVIVENPNNPPSVEIHSPSEGAAVSGLVTVSGTASDPDAGDAVTAVWVSVDGGPWAAASGTSQWTYSWNTASVEDGPHMIRARSSDGEANSSDASRGVTVQNHGPNAPPTCAITSPAPGATVSGKVLVEGIAADPDNGVRSVHVKFDSGVWLEASGNTSWSFLWDSGPITGGSHLISARAYDGIVNSSEVHINVEVNHPPSCAITSPAGSDVVTGVVTVQGTASDPDPGQAVTAVFVRIDSGDWTQATGTQSWSCKWNTSAGSSGQHTIHARSSDGTAESAEASRTVTVEKPPAAVTLSDPAEVGTDWVLLVWSRNSDTDFARYEVYTSKREGQPLSELSPRVVPAQSVTIYNYTGLEARTTYWFRVRVADNSGLLAVSNEVYATTERENTAPVAMLTASRTRAPAGSSITFSADGSYDPDRGGRIVRYQWDFEGRGRFDLDSGLISSQRHEFGRPGKYEVQVRVTDERGASTTASVNLTISGQPRTGMDTAAVLAVAVMVLAAVAAAGYLYIRRRPPVVESYYEETVRSPVVRRRQKLWPEDEQARPDGRKRGT